MVRITCDDGAVGVGYTYTIGTGGSSVVALLRDHLAPRLIGRDAAQIEAIWKDLFFARTRPRSARSPASRSRRSTRRCGTCGASAPGCRCGRWRAARSRGCRSTRPKAAGCIIRPQQLVDEALAAKAQGFRGAKIKVGKPSIAEDVARLSAVREAVGDAFEIMVDANQAFTVAEAMPPRARVRAAGARAGSRSRCRRRTWAATSSSPRNATMPIAVGESLYHPAHFREYLERGACSVVQVDCARIGGITPWLKVAHLAETFNVAGLPAFPDGAARVAVGGGAQRRVGGVHSAARRRHDVAAWRCATATRSPPRRAGPRHRLGFRRHRPRCAVARVPIQCNEENTMLTRSLAHHPPAPQRRRRHRARAAGRRHDAARREGHRRRAWSRPATRSRRARSRPASRCGATTRSSASPAATSRPASTCTCNNLAMGAFDRDYAFGADVQADAVRAPRRRRSWASCAPTAGSRRATTSASCRR